MLPKKICTAVKTNELLIWCLLWILGVTPRAAAVCKQNLCTIYFATTKLELIFLRKSCETDFGHLSTSSDFFRPSFQYCLAFVGDAFTIFGEDKNRSEQQSAIRPHLGELRFSSVFVAPESDAKKSAEIPPLFLGKKFASSFRPHPNNFLLSPSLSFERGKSRRKVEGINYRLLLFGPLKSYSSSGSRFLRERVPSCRRLGWAAAAAASVAVVAAGVGSGEMSPLVIVKGTKTNGGEGFCLPGGTIPSEGVVSHTWRVTVDWDLDLSPLNDCVRRSDTWKRNEKARSSSRQRERRRKSFALARNSSLKNNNNKKPGRKETSLF